MYGIWSGRVQPSTKRDSDALSVLAEACGGYSVALENTNGMSTLLGSLATQKAQYRLEYRSGLNTAGEHNLRLQVQGGFQAQTDPLVFSLDVQPPVVSWLRFPEDVTRKWQDPLQPAEEFPPTTLDFEAEISFPDGHPRSIATIRLLVDGQPASDCPAPCTGIRWDISKVMESESHTLQLSILDELGLEGQTEPRDLKIAVERPTLWDVFRLKYLTTVSILVALVLAGGLLIAAIAVMSRAGGSSGRGRTVSPDLLFPPAGGRAQGLRIRWRVKRPLRKGPSAAEPSAGDAAFVVLEPLESGKAPLVFAAADTVIGRDADNGAVIDDPSVSPRHARIVRMPDGTPWIFDLGSTAGTWRNFEEAPREGCALRDGDRLHFGRAAFRVRILLSPAGKEGDR